MDSESIYSEKNPEICILKLRGKVMRDVEIQEFKKITQEIINSKPKKLIVYQEKEDFNLLSGGLEHLIGMFAALDKITEIRLCKMENKFRTLMGVYGLDKKYDQYCTLEDAIKSYRD